MNFNIRKTSPLRITSYFYSGRKDIMKNDNWQNKNNHTHTRRAMKESAVTELANLDFMYTNNALP